MAWGGGTSLLGRMRKADTFAFAQDLVCDFVERAMNLSEAKEHEVTKRRAVRKDEKKLVSEDFQGTASGTKRLKKGRERGGMAHRVR